MVNAEFKHTGSGMELPNLDQLKDFAAVIRQKNDARKFEQIKNSNSGKLLITDGRYKSEIEYDRTKSFFVCEKLDIGIIPNESGVVFYALKSANALSLFKSIKYSQIEILETK